MSGFRTVEIKISADTFRRLKLVMELYPWQCGDPPANNFLTVDALADHELYARIRDQFPMVAVYEKRIAEAKRKIREEMKK